MAIRKTIEMLSILESDFFARNKNYTWLKRVRVVWVWMRACFVSAKAPWSINAAGYELLITQDVYHILYFTKVPLMINEGNEQSLLLRRYLHISHSKRSFKKKKTLLDIFYRWSTTKTNSKNTPKTLRHEMFTIWRWLTAQCYSVSLASLFSFSSSNHLRVDCFVSPRVKHNSRVVFVSCAAVAETAVVLTYTVRERLPVCFTCKY